MSRNITITISDEVFFNKKFQEIKGERSKIINDYFMQYCNIKPTDVPTKKKELENERLRLQAKMALLEENLERVEKEEEREKNRWVDLPK